MFVRRLQNQATQPDHQTKHLRPFGFFIEYREYDSSYPSIEKAEKQPRNPHLSKILKYLESGYCFAAMMGMICDPLQKNNPVIGPGHMLTDGVWCWPKELGYLIENYNIKLPDDFIKQMEERSWTPPKEDELDIAAIEAWLTGE